MQMINCGPIYKSRFLNSIMEFDSGVLKYEVDSIYPTNPYNLIRLNDGNLRITISVVGYDKNQIELTVTDNLLQIKGSITNRVDDAAYLHKGIPDKSFESNFKLSPELSVVDAKLVEGLLHISLRRELPEHMKTRHIAISDGLSGI